MRAGHINNIFTVFLVIYICVAEKLINRMILARILIYYVLKQNELHVSQKHQTEGDKNES